MESTGNIGHRSGALERYWKPTCQQREGAEPMSERYIWRRRYRIVGSGAQERFSRRLNGW